MYNFISLFGSNFFTLLLFFKEKIEYLTVLKYLNLNQI